ncbi:peptidase inhibitor family I36 protein [Nonomuraea sp. NPDC050310]|uniref:peptidase inhibitor family I36 protein n=1 Tax=unclassified Nonomuraea TaxID=2593643 RepID=UPI00340953E5
MKRMLVSTSVAVAAAAVALLSTSLPAAAKASAWSDCGYKNVCTYYNTNGGGSPARESEGNLGRHSGVRSIFNNGSPGGWDHIKLTYDYRAGGEVHRGVQCIHQGEKKNIVVPGGGPVEVISAVWVSPWTAPCDG